MELEEEEGSGTAGRMSPLSLPLSFFLSLSPECLRSLPERRLLIPSWGSQSMLVRLESKSEDIAFFYLPL